MKDIIKDYSSAISNNKYNQKVLFNTVDKLLHRKPKKRYPTASSKSELVNNFGDFFCSKIAVLRNELTDRTINNNQPNPVLVLEPPIQCESREFQTVTEQEVGNIVDKISKKSCELDRTPATILKRCKETLLTTFANIINMSLETGRMPVQFKKAVLKPKLKKNTNLELEEYSNFRPISSLKSLR